MSKKFIILSLAFSSAVFAISTSSCKKELDEIVDCLAEESLASIDASINPANNKEYTFKANYGGTHTLGTVKWKFGDGSEATTVGSATITHTYASGSYQVTAEASITNGSSSCTPVLKKTVVVN